MTTHTRTHVSTARPAPAVVASPLLDTDLPHFTPHCRPPIGSWCWDPASGRWDVSAELAQLLRLPPAEVQRASLAVAGTRGLRLVHVHPDDRPAVRAALGACVRGTSFTLQARLLRGDGPTMLATVVGGPLDDGPAGTATVGGLVVDVTDRPGTRTATDREARLALEVEQLRTAMLGRTAIEQAKGALMMLIGCSDQVAFDVLRHLSNCTNRKVREISTLVVASASGEVPLPRDLASALREVFPHQRTPR